MSSNLNCRWCNISFAKTSRFQKHMAKDIRIHPYYCQICKSTFDNFKALEEHLKGSRQHLSEDETTRMKHSDSYCRRCRRQFSTAVLLVDHLIQAHGDKVPNCCEQCGTCFKNANGLTSHKASPVHNKRDIPCPHCGRLFKTTSGVAHHLESKCLKKVTDMVIQWDTDNQITDPVYTDRLEEVTSDNDGDYVLVPRGDQQLPQVLDVIVTADAWDDAVQGYPCPAADCGRLFTTLSGINQHLASQKHRANPTTFHCPKCESRFAVVSALIQHLESGACGLAQPQMVKEIYTGLFDIFHKLLKL